MVTMRHCWEVDIGLSESAKKLTLDDLEEVISKGHENENGHGCLRTKMFPIARPLKVHLDL